MGMSTERGFTVIELLLFLGISGALFVGLLVGVNNTIGQQQYRESVVSLTTLLQNQYNEVTNIRNGRVNGDQNPKDYACDTDAKVDANNDPAAAKIAGASGCVLLGRIIEINKGGTTDNGGAITVFSVVGYAPCDPNEINCHVNEGSDVDVLANYKPRVTAYDKDNLSTEWGSKIVQTGNHNDLTANIAILRSPASGLVRVFWNQSDPIADQNSLVSNTPDGLLSANNTARPLTMCIVGDSIIAQKQSITINPAIGGPDGVSVNQADDTSCG